MNFNNFWSNVSRLSVADTVPNETVKEIGNALKAVEPKKEIESV